MANDTKVNTKPTVLKVVCRDRTERARLHAAAASAGLSLSSWLRAIGLRAAEREENRAWRPTVQLPNAAEVTVARRPAEATDATIDPRRRE